MLGGESYRALAHGLENALRLLRGSSAFDRLDHRAFVAEVIAQHNRRHAAAIDAERAARTAAPALLAHRASWKMIPTV